MPTRLLIALLGLCVLLREPSLAQSQQWTYIEHVNLVPMDSERLVPDQTVTVLGNTIVNIGSNAMTVNSGGNSVFPAGAIRVDGRGKYVMPALAEMHAHIPTDPAEAERVLFMYVANGIGTIRSMLGDPAHFRLRERVMRGEIIGPTMLLGGPSFNGQTAATPAAAAARVAEQKKAGYNFLKIHPGVPLTAFNALAAAADTASIRFAGHVPLEVGLRRALQAKYWTIDHLDGYMEALAEPRARDSENFGVNLMSRIDESRIPALAAETKAAGVWNVPTQILLENWYGPDSPEAMQRRPEMQYVRPAEVAQWMSDKRRNLADYSAKDRERFIAVRRRLIKALQDTGAGLLLGSDAPQVWNVPGFSVHRELASYVAAGLTPYQALATGTRNVALHLGNLEGKSERRGFDTGVVTPGHGRIGQGTAADFVLLDANPLENISNTSRIAGVMIRGRWIPKAEIDRRLAELRAR
jgi:imidazolonepropionase-like amidohydrolase